MSRIQGRAVAALRRGFTMIELIIVIVILGVLSAVALPKFIDMRGDAEKASIEAWVGALRSAYGLMYAATMVANVGYTNPFAMVLPSIVRCDGVDQLEPRGEQWQGNHLALAGLRNAVFKDNTQMACSYGSNSIEFDTRSGRHVSIVNNGQGVTWSASPAY